MARKRAGKGGGNGRGAGSGRGRGGKASGTAKPTDDGPSNPPASPNEENPKIDSSNKVAKPTGSAKKTGNLTSSPKRYRIEDEGTNAEDQERIAKCPKLSTSKLAPRLIILSKWLHWTALANDTMAVHRCTEVEDTSEHWKNLPPQDGRILISFLRNAAAMIL